MKKLLLVLLIVANFCASAQDDQYVLMISFDGFRHDYVDMYDTPHFDEFIKNGTAAESLIPSFPTKTFPNHYTLVTGMYPANHGLVDNSFFDPEREVVYMMRKRDLVEDPYFYGGTPLWQLVQQHGMKSASYFWVGSEAPISGSYPDYYYRYDGSVPNEKRIDQVIEWLKLPEEERPRFITLYFSLVDSQGHRTGPVSKETGKKVTEADRLLGVLMRKLATVDLPVNTVITSDHGMVAVKNDRSSVIKLERLYNKENEIFQTVINATHAHLYFEDKSKVDSVFEALTKKAPQLSFYKKESTPSHWAYRKGERIGDIIACAPTGYILHFGTWLQPKGESFGIHGYDPGSTKDVHGIFYASGPRIKAGYEIQSFENVHVYPLVCKILDIPVPENIDGKIPVLLGTLN